MRAIQNLKLFLTQKPQARMLTNTDKPDRCLSIIFDIQADEAIQAI